MPRQRDDITGYISGNLVVKGFDADRTKQEVEKALASGKTCCDTWWVVVCSCGGPDSTFSARRSVLRAKAIKRCKECQTKKKRWHMNVLFKRKYGAGL